MTTFTDLFGSYKFKDVTERAMFEQMFEKYSSELPANFYENQFKLAEKYPIADYEAWSNFLQHPAFDTWKSKQINTIANTEMDKALAGSGLKDKESLNLLKARQDVVNKDKKDTKPTIIVMPESLFFKKED